MPRFCRDVSVVCPTSQTLPATSSGTNLFRCDSYDTVWRERVDGSKERHTRTTVLVKKFAKANKHVVRRVVVGAIKQEDKKQNTLSMN